MNELINKVINTNSFCEELYIDIDKILEIKDESIVAPDEYANTKSLINILSCCINKFPTKEQTVIIKRFGLFGSKPQTLSSIAKQIGSGRERVRQIENKVIRRLRHPIFKLTELINEI